LFARLSASSVSIAANGRDRYWWPVESVCPVPVVWWLWHGIRVFDGCGALEAVVRHATLLDDDYDDIAPTLEALSACGDLSLVPGLREALDRFLDDGNFYGRDLIASALAGIQGVAALPVLLRASARELGDDQDGLSAEIVELLQEDPVAARGAVLELAAGDAPEARRVGLWALGFVVEAQDIELLAAAASDTDPQVRSAAIGAIPDPRGDDRAFGVLVGALRDVDDGVRVSAASRLGYTGRANAVAPLALLVTDRAPRVRSMAAYALGKLGSAEAATALLPLLKDPQRHVRERAAEALGRVGGPAAASALLALAVDADPETRAQAARELPGVLEADPRVWQQITTLARDPDAAVRVATLSGLAGTAGEHPDRAQLLAELSGDRDPMVRQRVAVTARHIAPGSARDILRSYASDRDQTVRRLAATELDRLTGHTAR
jgi:HEAT repeat protein